jgi:hypothetical protein
MFNLGDRKYIPAVHLSTSIFEIENLDGQGLTISWDVTRTIGPEADMGEVRVVNLSESISRGIHETWRAASGFVPGVNMALSVGWDGVPKLMMEANIWDITPNKREIPDVVTVFKLGDGVDALRDQVNGKALQGANLANAIGLLVRIVPSRVDVAGGGLGLKYPKESRDLVAKAASQVAAWRIRNMPTGGNTRDEITNMMATIGLTWRVQNGAFIAMRGGAISKAGPILRPGTGLIDYEVRNDGGIMLRALTEADVEPGMQIQVQDENGESFGARAYRVERVKFSGVTTGDSIMEIEAAKAVFI